jgi:hypothetical protein
MKQVASTFFFESESNPEKVHQTIRWTTGELSCSCPGWTRRNPPGGRTCSHVRLVEAGLESRAINAVHTRDVEKQSTPVRRTPQRAMPEPTFGRNRRKFQLTD